MTSLESLLGCWMQVSSPTLLSPALFLVSGPRVPPARDLERGVVQGPGWATEVRKGVLPPWPVFGRFQVLLREVGHPKEEIRWTPGSRLIQGQSGRVLGGVRLLSRGKRGPGGLQWVVSVCTCGQQVQGAGQRASALTGTRLRMSHTCTPPTHTLHTSQGAGHMEGAGGRLGPGPSRILRETVWGAAGGPQTGWGPS